MAVEQTTPTQNNEGKALRPEVLLRADELKFGNGWFAPRTLTQIDQDLPQINDALLMMRRGIEAWSEFDAAPTYSAAVIASRDVINDTLGRERHREIARVGYDFYRGSVTRSLAASYYLGRNSRVRVPADLVELANDVSKTTTRVIAIPEVNKASNMDYPDIESAKLNLFLLGAFAISDSQDGALSVSFPIVINGKSYLWQHKEGLSKAWVYREWTRDALHPLPRPTLEDIRAAEKHTISEIEEEVLKKRQGRTIERQASLEKQFDEYLDLEASGKLDRHWKDFGNKYKDEIQVHSRDKEEALRHRPPRITAMIRFPSTFRRPSQQEQDRANELRRNASRALDRYYQEHPAVESSQMDDAVSVDERLAKARGELAEIEARKPHIDPADAIAPVLRQIAKRKDVSFDLSGDRLGIFQHPDQEAGRRMGRFFQDVVDIAVNLREAFRERVYSNSSFLSRLYSKFNGDLSKVDTLLFQVVAMSDLDYYDPEQARQFKFFSELVDRLIDIWDLTPEEKQNYLKRGKTQYLEAHGSWYNPFSPSHEQPIKSFESYKFDRPAIFDFVIKPNSHNKSPINQDHEDEDTYSQSNQNVIRFRWNPLPFARYRNQFGWFKKYDDLMPDVVQQMWQQTTRKLHNIAEIQRMVDEARDTALIPSFEIALSSIDGHDEYRKPKFKDYAVLRGELYEEEEQDSYRICLDFRVKGFPDINSKMTIGRRNKGVRITVAELRPPLQRFVEDFRGLRII